MKKQKNSVKGKFSSLSQIPFDMLSGLPYIKICSNREITVEDAGKLLHYDNCLVKVRQGKNKLSITGNELVIKFLANNDIRVEGCIYGISFEP